MITADNGRVHMIGTTAEIGIDLLAILECFNNEVENGEFEMEFLNDMFQLKHNTITTFTRNFALAVKK